MHLDASRRAALWEALAANPAQAFLTGTDPEPFAPLQGAAEFLLAGGGTLRPDPSYAPVGPVFSPPRTLY